MPTFDRTPQSDDDLEELTAEQRARFQRKVGDFVADLDNPPFRSGLRVKRIRGASGLWEMTWAPDGRATWQYGEEIRAGQAHVIWRRVGTHSVFNAP